MHDLTSLKPCKEGLYTPWGKRLHTYIHMYIMTPRYATHDCCPKVFLKSQLWLCLHPNSSNLTGSLGWCSLESVLTAESLEPPLQFLMSNIQVAEIFWLNYPDSFDYISIAFSIFYLPLLKSGHLRMCLNDNVFCKIPSPGETLPHRCLG